VSGPRADDHASDRRDNAQNNPKRQATEAEINVSILTLIRKGRAERFGFSSGKRRQKVEG
jgi:hypothetical protein